MMGVITFVLVMVAVFYVLPKMPRYVRVGFWVTITVAEIIEGDALFAALCAAIAMNEVHES